MGDHTTSDDALRYRMKHELEEWVKRDPIERLRKYMNRIGLWNDDYEKKVQAEAAEKVRNAVGKFESVKPPEIRDLFDWTYEQLPPNLKEQYEVLARTVEGGK
jgi:pyruvate dehydrogenase E1 component alpha subunit